MTTTPEVHHHRWRVASAHPVSEGLVIYHRCSCGQWRLTRTPSEPVAEILPRRPRLRVVEA